MKNNELVKSIISGFSGRQNTISFPALYVEIVKDLNTALILNQVVFWSDRTKRKDGFFYKSYKEWGEETFLSQYQVKRSIKKLEELSLVETKLKKANGAPTIHYKANIDVLTSLISEHFDYQETKQSDYEETKQSDYRETKQSDYQETKQSLTDDYTDNHTDEYTYEENPAEAELKNANVNKQLKEDFESLWKKHPNKKGSKKTSFKNYVKAIEGGTKHEEISKGLDNFIAYCQQNKWYTPAYASTWFNQERWENDYQTSQNKPLDLDSVFDETDNSDQWARWEERKNASNM